MVDLSGRHDLVHDLGSSSVGRKGQTAADDFAKSRHIGLDPEDFLGSTVSDPEAGHDFIEDQDHAVIACFFAKGGQEFARWDDRSHVSDDRFEDDSGD